MVYGLRSFRLRRRFTRSGLSIANEINFNERRPAKACHADGGASGRADTVLRKIARVDRVERGEITVELAEVDAHEYGILVTITGMSQDTGEVLEADNCLIFDAFSKRCGGRVRVRWKLSGDV